MKTGNKPSVKRISEITGFSPATVSNALNMKRGVNKDTAERIFQVAGELGYFTGSKSLKSIKFVQFRRNGGIIDDSPFHPAVIEGVEEAARENGLATIYIRLNYTAPDYLEQVSQLTSDSNGGVILLATEMLEEDFDPFMHCKCPIILLDGWCERQPFNGVLINNIDSAQNAVGHLIARGHRKIGYVRGSFRIKAFQAREYGYRQALLDHGLELEPRWVVTVGTKTDSAYEGMLSYLDTKPELPTAFFVDNDLIAFGVMRALKDRGYRVPDDVSIVGFDDVAYCTVSSPALTTIHVNKRSMGWEAVRRLLTMMDDPNTGIFKIESCTEFVERDSVRSYEAEELTKLKHLHIRLHAVRVMRAAFFAPCRGAEHLVCAGG